MEFSGIITFLKILSTLISIAFIGGAIASGLGILSLQKQHLINREEHFNIRKQTESPQRKRWKGIVAQFKSSDPTFWRMAIIDADTMLEEMITGMGFIGANFGEKLKHLQQQGIAWADAAWDVHLLRNKLAHEGTRYPLSDREAYRAYRIYENLLESNGYLA